MNIDSDKLIRYLGELSENLRSCLRDYIVEDEGTDGEEKREIGRMYGQIEAIEYIKHHVKEAIGEDEND